jgi:hypothetical protein
MTLPERAWLTSVGVLHVGLLSRGVHLRVEVGRLRFRAPAGVLTEQDHQDLQRSKPELIKMLRGCCGDCGTTLYQPESLDAGCCQRCRTTMNSKPEGS